MKISHLFVLTTICMLSACGRVTVGDEVNTPDQDYGSTNGGVRVGQNSHVGNLDSVNGGLKVGSNSQAGNLDTVNGGISLAEGARVRNAETVNGGIKADRDVVVEGSLETVNGGITVWPGAQVGGDISTVNGKIEIHRALVGGSIMTSKGDIEIDDGSVVKGDIRITRSGWNISIGKKDASRVVVGEDCVVEGNLTFKAPVDLYVHESARIGAVEGAEVKRYSGSSP